MFRNYEESGPTLLTDPTSKLRGSFLLENTSTTIANTLRRCILTETRSVGFRADLTNDADPGIKIRRNTSVIFNEMLAHRITLCPVAIRDIDGFDPARYECVLRMRNETRGPIHADSLLHVCAGDFTVRERREDGSFEELGAAAAAAMFPADPLTKDTPLIVTLRPQWNSEQPPEEIDLTAFPVIGRGRDYMGFCPVSQCSFANTPDPDPVRQEQFFQQWLAEFRKVAAPTELTADVLENYRKEWSTMAIQRCFLVNENGEPNSFSFTVESIGIRSVPEIVLEGLQATIDLITPYTDSEKTSADLGLTIHPVESRMNGVEVLFKGQEHTLGNLLQTMITELYLDSGAADSPIESVGYKVKHPLDRAMTLRIGVRESAGDAASIARSVIAAGAQRALGIFQDLQRSWTAIGAGGLSAPAPGLEG